MPKPPELTPYQAFVKKWSHCKLCSLHEDRKHIVHGRGKMPCDYLFVGEGPGDSEDVLAQPFKGPAGQLLNEMIEKALTKAKIDSPRLGFMNVVGCIPKENGNKIGQPRPDQIQACSTRTIELINLFKPSTGIFRVGQVADQYFHDLERAKSLYKTIGGTVWLTSIRHPASILKAPVSQRALLYQQTIMDLVEAFEMPF